MPMTPEELRVNLKGVVHLVMTPFDENDEVDENALRKSVKHVADALKGEDAVFLVTGSTAEFYAMTDEENKTVIRTVVEEVAGKFPVIAGTGRCGTKLTIEMSQAAQEQGADGVLVVNPYYHLVTKEGLFNHHKAVAENIDIGIVIYNNAVTSKVWIQPDLMARLSKIPNIVGDKENTSNVVAYYWMQGAVDPKDMTMLTGVGQLFYPFEIMFHSKGYVTELANFAPDVAVALHRAAKRKDIDKMAALMDKRIAPYHRFLSRCAQRHGEIPTVLSPHIAINELPIYQGACKEAMNLIGLPGGKARAPMENLTAEEIEELRGVLKTIGVL
jgi:4-hydroxy-tetrahydrodipicolinate synthase